MTSRRSSRTPPPIAMSRASIGLPSFRRSGWVSDGGGLLDHDAGVAGRLDRRRPGRRARPAGRTRALSFTGWPPMRDPHLAVPLCRDRRDDHADAADQVGAGRRGVGAHPAGRRARAIGAERGRDRDRRRRRRDRPRAESGAAAGERGRRSRRRSRTRRRSRRSMGSENGPSASGWPKCRTSPEEERDGEQGDADARRCSRNVIVTAFMRLFPGQRHAASDCVAPEGSAADRQPGTVRGVIPAGETCEDHELAVQATRARHPDRWHRGGRRRRRGLTGVSFGAVQSEPPDGPGDRSRSWLDGPCAS